MADPDRNERVFPCAVQGGVTGEASRSNTFFDEDSEV